MHNHTETALYNLSFGPRGAIVDDDISHFTYALDRLSMLPHHPLFCVAVGNDGDLPYPFNRIQAPSDLVNGLGIGAYTFDKNGEKSLTCRKLPVCRFFFAIVCCLCILLTSTVFQ